MISIFRSQRTPILLVLSFFSIFVNAEQQRSISNQEKQCRENTRTELEGIYCQVKYQLGKKGLPSFNAFRQQPSRMQSLLLKPYVRNTNIVLPAVAKNKPKQHISKKYTTDNISQKENIPSAKDVPAASEQDLVQCQLQQTRIQCAGQHYHLETNKQNTTLPTSAFSEENQMLFPEKEKDAFKDSSDSIYLSHAYPIYIEKMLTIGLGDSTMSYTKFVEVYWQGKQQKQDFVERFKTMFEQLKLEKQRNGTVARYNQNYPKTIKSCMPLNARIIVCDNKAQNWIYVLRPSNS